MAKNKITSFFVPAIVVLCLIFLRFQYGVLLFHTLAELFSVVIGILMLVVVWNTREFTHNNFLIYLGIGYFWIAVLDTWHTFTVVGMPFFNITDAEPTLHFWIYTRLIEALLLLSAPIFLKKKLNHYGAISLFGALTLVVIWASLTLKQPLMLTSQGLTFFKISMEYLVIVLLSIAIYIYIKQRTRFPESVLQNLLASIVITICAELCFTLYTDFNGIPFMMGHLFKFLSFWMIYRAIIDTTLKEPMSVMAQESIQMKVKILAGQKLKESENLLRTVINATPDWIFLKDKEYRYLFVNDGFANALNLKPNDFYGKTDDELGFPKELIYGNEAKGIRGFRVDDSDVLNGRTLYNPYDPAIFSDGSFHVFDTYKTPLLDSNNEIYAALGIARDVTQRLDMEAKLHQAATVYDSSSEGILITDADVKVTAVNKAFSRITGYSENDVLGKDPKILASGKHDALFYKKMWNELVTLGHWQGEIYNQHKNGKIYPEWLNISEVKNNEGIITNYVSTFSDISKLKESEEALKYIAQHDQLTELPNRILLIYSLENAIFRAKRNKTKIAILFLDLDNFKQINDTLGHSYGDVLLKKVAQRFSGCLRDEDIISRQGGDEFLVLLEELHDSKEASIIAEKLINCLKEPLYINESEFYIGVSIGISLYPDDGIDSETLIKNADSAMYYSKNKSKNQYSYFTSELNQYSKRRFKLENALRVALSKKEIFIVYQPQIDLKQREVYGFEALVRWQHPELGFISPVEFIPIAESTGLINKIGLFVLEESIRQIQRLNEKFNRSLNISVNVSSRQFDKPELPELINHLLNKNNCPSENLKIEITESLLLQESTTVLELLTLISNLGVKIALDDFGTGYSSLAYLKKFPIDIVKIDQSFVRDINSDAEDAILVKTIIAMANGLNMDMIAEGVETSEQKAFLEVEECHLIQGYYFSKPLQDNEVDDFLLNWRFK
jgi:diguanylate cyclase (GGDEF)-like protein/PAS domain S-box-containing protein